MATNDFLTFATGGGANVESQATYAADTARTDGNQPGVASSALNNKALRQANFVASQVAQYMSDITGANANDDGNTTEFLQTLKAAMQRTAPVIDVYTSGSGTWTMPYYFFCASGNATVGATYTNNSVTFTVMATIAAGTVLQARGAGTPSASGTLTKASGTGDATITFYAYRAPLVLEGEAIGAGGGGGGSGTTTTGGNGATASTATTFGSSLITANGGSGGAAGGAGVASGGAGGSATVAAPAVSILVQAGQAGGSPANTSNGTGGTGGNTVVGGSGPATLPNSGGAAGIANSGGGGSGAPGGSTVNNAWGGGGGGYARFLISSPSTSYAYVVGSGATGGTAGTSGLAGGTGAAGRIMIMAKYQ